MELYFSKNKTDPSIKETSWHKLSIYGATILDIENKLPTPNYRFISIEGRSDVIDLSEHNGKMTYKNDRTTIITFDIKESVETMSNVNALVKLVHGNVFNFIIGENSTKVYRGRFAIEKSKTQNITYTTYTLKISYLDNYCTGGTL